MLLSKVTNVIKLRDKHVDVNREFIKDESSSLSTSIVLLLEKRSPVSLYLQ